MQYIYIGVSKNRGTPKWMVYSGNPIEMDDLVSNFRKQFTLKIHLHDIQVGAL